MVSRVELTSNCSLVIIQSGDSQESPGGNSGQGELGELGGVLGLGLTNSC